MKITKIEVMKIWLIARKREVGILSALGFIDGTKFIIKRDRGQYFLLPRSRVFLETVNGELIDRSNWEIRSAELDRFLNTLN